MNKRGRKKHRRPYLAAIGPGDFQPEMIEGVYLRHDGRVLPRVAACEVPCPYCREPLHEAFDAHPHRVRRVVQSFDDGRALVEGDAIPPTHRVMGCPPCRAVFTLPRAHAEGDRA